MSKKIIVNEASNMNKIFVISGLVLASTLGYLAVDLQPAYAGHSRCQHPSNRGAYCLRLGDEGQLVYNLIERLRCAGYYNIGNDSRFGPVTDQAVRRVQRDHGLTPDGVAGPQTTSLIERLCSGQASSPSVNQTVNICIYCRAEARLFYKIRQLFKSCT